MITIETSTHHAAADSHWDRRDDLLRQARQFDFRTMHLEPFRSERTAIIREAEREHGMAVALEEEWS